MHTATTTPQRPAILGCCKNAVRMPIWCNQGHRKHFDIGAANF